MVELGYKGVVNGAKLTVYGNNKSMLRENNRPSQVDVDFEGGESVGIQDSDDLTVKQSSSEKKDDKE